MSPILDLQRREMESGRVRFGNKMGSRPNRLDHPLLTSPDRELIEAVAEAHGGNVSRWPGDPENQWQTEVHGDLAILVPVSPEPFTSWWERWSGGGCMRRCDGITDTINEQPCDCDKAADKRACSATTRFIVLLPETGEARWRVETKSINAAMEIPQALESAMGEKTGEVIPGVLRVEQRKGKKGKVPVPVVRLGSGRPAPTQESEGPREPESVRGPETPGPDVITEAQRRRLFAIAKTAGVSRDDVKVAVLGITGQDSTSAIPRDRYDEIVTAIEQAGRESLFAPERREDVG